MENFKKTITKEGVKIEHPSGEIQILTPKRLKDIKIILEKRKAQVDKDLADLVKDISDVDKK